MINQTNMEHHLASLVSIMDNMYLSLLDANLDCQHGIITFFFKDAKGKHYTESVRYTDSKPYIKRRLLSVIQD